MCAVPADPRRPSREPMSRGRGPRGGDRGSRNVLVLPTLFVERHTVAEAECTSVYRCRPPSDYNAGRCRSS